MRRTEPDPNRGNSDPNSYCYSHRYRDSNRYSYRHNCTDTNSNADSKFDAGGAVPQPLDPPASSGRC
jgi:hypothetical protein